MRSEVEWNVNIVGIEFWNDCCKAYLILLLTRLPKVIFWSIICRFVIGIQNLPQSKLLTIAQPNYLLTCPLLQVLSRRVCGLFTPIFSNVMLTNFTKTFDTEEFSFYLDEFVDYLHQFFSNVMLTNFTKTLILKIQQT